MSVTGSGIASALAPATGQTLWTRALGQEPVYRPLAVDGQRVVLTLFDARVLLLDSRTGRIRWQIHTTAPAFTPTRIGTRLVFGTYDGRILALDVDTGERLWSHGLGGRVRISPFNPPGGVWASNDQGAIVLLDLATGRVLREERLPGVPIGSPIPWHDDLLVFLEGSDPLCVRPLTLPKKETP